MPSKGIDEQSGAERDECPNYGVLNPLQDIAVQLHRCLPQ